MSATTDLPLYQETLNDSAYRQAVLDPPPSGKFGTDWTAWLEAHPFVITEVAEDDETT